MKYILVVFLATIGLSVNAELIAKNEDDVVVLSDGTAPIAIPVPMSEPAPLIKDTVNSYSVPNNVAITPNVIQAQVNLPQHYNIPYYGHNYDDDSSDSSSNSESRERKYRKHKHRRHSYEVYDYEYPSYNYPSNYVYSHIPNAISNPFYYPNRDRKQYRKHRHTRYGRHNKHSSSDSHDW